MMKKYSAIAAFCLFTATASYADTDYSYNGNTYTAYTTATNQQSTPYLSLTLDYAGYRADLRGEDLNFSGGSLGVSTSPRLGSGLNGQIGYLTDSEHDLTMWNFELGWHDTLVRSQDFYLLGKIALGYAFINADYLSNAVSYSSIPLELEAGYYFLPNLALYGNVGYTWYWDITDDVTCYDGTTSNLNSNDYGCWGRGGVQYFNDHLGNHDGITWRAGLRWDF